MLKEPILLTEDSVRYAMLGGSILGGGGGGSAESGGQTGRLAVQFRDLYLTPLDEIDPDAVIVTASMVGAPAAKERYVAPADMMQLVYLSALKSAKTRSIRPPLMYWNRSLSYSNTSLRLLV